VQHIASEHNSFFCRTASRSPHRGLQAAEGDQDLHGPPQGGRGGGLEEVEVLGAVHPHHEELEHHLHAPPGTEVHPSREICTDSPWDAHLGEVGLQDLRLGCFFEALTSV
jgi:hypothetical protein